MNATDFFCVYLIIGYHLLFGKRTEKKKKPARLGLNPQYPGPRLPIWKWLH